jgi:hypothetical protein
MNDPIAAINNIVAQSAATSTVRWLVCPECKDIKEHDMATGVPAAVCPACNQRVSRVLRPSLASAQLAVTGMEARVMTGQEPAATNEPTPITRTRKSKPRVEPTVSQPTPEIPNNLVEAAAAPQLPASSEPTNPVSDEPVHAVSAGAQARIDATNKLIAKYHLTAHTPAKVCTGEVLTWGFTKWSEDSEGNRKPAYCIRDVADSGEYMKSLNDQRRIDGTTGTDVVVCTDLPAEVRATAFNGELIASTRDSVRTHRVTCGARVVLGAKVSSKGRLIWCVLGNA